MKGITLKKYLCLAATVLLASLCFGQSAGAVRPSGSPHDGRSKTAKTKIKVGPVVKKAFIGVSENDILSEDPDKSMGVAQLGTAFNQWRLNRYFQFPSDTNVYKNTPTDREWLCNGVRSLVAAGIKTLVLTYMPTVNTGYPIDLDPKSNEQRSYVNIVIDGDLDALYGSAPNLGCARGPDGQALLAIWIQPGNEMNIDTFCQPQNDADHRACAQAAVLLQASVYTFIKGTEQAKYGLPITVVGASVASHHTPWVYLQQYQRKMMVLTRCICMDVFDFHPYAQWGSCDQTSGVNMYKPLLANGRATFGKIFGGGRLQIWYGEWAVQTQESTTEGYINYEPASCQMVYENQQLDVWTTILSIVAKQPLVIGIVTEHVCDEQDMLYGFQSGLWTYGCKRQKPGAAAILKVAQSYRQN